MCLHMQNPPHNGYILSDRQKQALREICRQHLKTGRPQESDQALHDFVWEIGASLSFVHDGWVLRWMTPFVQERKFKGRTPREKSDQRDSMFREMMWVLKDHHPVQGEDIKKKRLPQGNDDERPSNPNQCYYYTWDHLGKHYYIFPKKIRSTDVGWVIISMQGIDPDYDTDDTVEHMDED